MPATARPSSPAERTLAAEVRAVEEGHQARRAGDGRHFVVTSDTRHGTSYYVRVVATGDVTVFVCDHPVVLGHADSPARTYIPCKHGALCARRLEREGLLQWHEGRWVATDLANRLAGHQPDADPFEGL